MAFVIWDWKKPENKVLTGKLTAKLNNMPPFGKKFYGFELDSGEIFYCWGTSILVGLLAPLPFMTKIKLTFLGKGRAAPKDKFDKLLFEMEILSLPAETRKKKPKEKLKRTNA